MRLLLHDNLWILRSLIERNAACTTLIYVAIIINDSIDYTTNTSCMDINACAQMAVHTFERLPTGSSHQP